MSQVQQTEEAKNDLINIWTYTYQAWGEQQADRYLDNIEKVCSFLVDSPLICRLRTELDRPVRIHHIKHHLIIYIEAPNGIKILRFLHESMDYQGQLDEGNA